MAYTTSRPDGLPDFRDPPLNEVVLGVQFSPVKGYQQIYAGEVRNLFKSEYPQVQEQPPLPPEFEAFGLSSPSAKINLVTGATHDRFWFLTPLGDELIQFQQDRLLHNWRKVGDETNPYPRFEAMLDRFRSELERLQAYMGGFSAPALAINQCEISYINHIDVDSSRSDDWLRYVSFATEPDDFSLNFREVIRDSEGRPCARFSCEAVTGMKSGSRRTIVLTLTVRGAPKGPEIDSALDFITSGRKVIVSRFADVTTDVAHKKWGRVK
ncbi:TIGR04255 family protein [Thiobacillus sedimenti]|uniref:TIGR04255 family protein n=1 Tax=Thiobacillus sedimenti TaxID=3110231 RepID=A0ABZ1CJ07_9PROT|nr:TIGR04255 family protein [Thiobacillus sp. SCUT-2]WRS39374.1 TIGR04255 family protein [Thiobacillus sp. SCUT-2]